MSPPRHDSTRLRLVARSACWPAFVLLLLAACATTAPKGTEPEVVAAGVELPADREALLSIADEASALGPGGPDLVRSLAAAERALSLDAADGEAAWRAARALYYRTMSVPDDEAAELAARCMERGETGVKTSSSAAAHFFMALCMGARAQRRHMEGLGLITRMVERAEAARALDPSFAHAGPDRMLGGIYLRAPSWPTSVGDPEAAIEHLERAVQLAPAWPENHLWLAEAYAAEDRHAEARDALARARETLATAIAEGWRPFFQAQLAELEEKLGRES